MHHRKHFFYFGKEFILRKPRRFCCNICSIIFYIDAYVYLCKNWVGIHVGMVEFAGWKTIYVGYQQYGLLFSFPTIYSTRSLLSVILSSRFIVRIHASVMQSTFLVFHGQKQAKRKRFPVLWKSVFLKYSQSLYDRLSAHFLESVQSFNQHTCR